MPDGKRKLTLSVDAETVERAKGLGINISDLTEQVLRSFTFKAGDDPDETVRHQREELFNSMIPLLRRYRTKIKVGEWANLECVGDEQYPGDVEGEVTLRGDGKFYLSGGYVASTGEEPEGTLEDLEEDYEIYFSTTEEILKEFLKVIETERASRQQSVEALVVARKVVEAIAQLDSAELGSGKEKESDDEQEQP